MLGGMSARDKMPHDKAEGLRTCGLKRTQQVDQLRNANAYDPGLKSLLIYHYSLILLTRRTVHTVVTRHAIEGSTGNCRV